MPNILIAVTGGIAAYKTAALASAFIKNSYSVRVIMTRNAERFITPLTFKTLTSQQVYTDMWEDKFEENHISLSTWARVLLVAPASANTIAKIANGIADNLLTSVLLDFNGTVFICPAMHENMWNNRATVQNVEVLKERGINFIGPEQGRLACGDSGLGRMSEPDTIYKTVDSFLKS